MNVGRRSASLRLRLLVATLVSLIVALAGAYGWLSSLFRDHVMRQFDQALVLQLDQLTARLQFDAQGLPVIPAGSLSDPRWDRPYSGLYWQIDSVSDDGQARRGVRRSRSLWDLELGLAVDALADGATHAHDLPGPPGAVLRVVERSLQTEDARSRWRVSVAADTQPALEASSQFQGVLAASLAVLGLCLALAAWAQLAVGLAPLRALQSAVQQVREGRSPRLTGHFPAELKPLVDDFNSVLDLNAQVVTRARTQAGNLAHALKTPLAVLDNAARSASAGQGGLSRQGSGGGGDARAGLAGLVSEQVQVAQRHIQWHLARARAAATPHLPGQRTPLAPALHALVRVMGKVHAPRQLSITLDELPAGSAFAGEAQDLQEMLGNLLDNACRYAHSRVHVAFRREGQSLNLSIDDDGPGIEPERRAAVLERGVRLDESTPGSGLGLAIVLELAQLYGGSLQLDQSQWGGLSVRLSLPAARDGA